MQKIVDQKSLKFSSIKETSSEFLSLFPHRYDFIHAPHPEPGEKPEWKTESRHPLSDRLIQEGDSLYGIRFGKTTRYLLTDIDIHSLYHPRHDPFAVSRLVAALEPIGLVSFIPITSSYSGGIHLYFPFDTDQTSYELAQAVQTLLEKAGFKIAPGQLEIFPNDRGFVNGKPALHSAHRLPLQAGSYILDQDLQPICSTQEEFVKQWQFCQRRNPVTRKAIKQIIKNRRKKYPLVKRGGEKLLNDLNAEIEPGWTGAGQTNHLLGRIAYRTRVFHHTIHGGSPLIGDDLVKEIISIAQSLPGYDEWCQHRHEIEAKAADWARQAEQKRYAYDGSRKKATIHTGNDAPQRRYLYQQRKSEDARERIRRAIAQMLESSTLPANPTARRDALLACGIGGETLYKYKDLWHPEFLLPVDFGVNAQSNEAPPDPPDTNKNTQREKGAPECPSLLVSNSSNTPLGKVFKGFEPSPCRSISSTTYRDLKQAEARERHIIKMRQYHDSDDPILIQAAKEWAECNPGLL